MNFQQLRYVREAVRQNLNLTEVANALYTSQSGVSKQIKELEDELGIEIFVRRGKRLTGLSEPGKSVLALIERILLDTENLRRAASHYASRDAGRLVVATTHTQARYALPDVIPRFREMYPKVHLVLRQGSPTQIAQMLVHGEADIAIATEGLNRHSELVTFPCYTWRHVVIVPKTHPLAAVRPLTLEAIAEYPIITYEQELTGRAHIDAAFERAGLAPDIVLSAVDSDVIKTYVRLGLGVGIVAQMAMATDGEGEGELIVLEGELFEPNTTLIGLRRGALLRQYAYRLIEMFAPHLTEADVAERLKEPESSADDD